MNRKMIMRYLVVMAVLVICAGAAWYFVESGKQYEDAVLARVEEDEGELLARAENLYGRENDAEAEVTRAYE